MNETVELTKDEKTWGMVCHLSTLCFFIGIPFGNIIAPLVIWLMKKDESEFINHNGKEALNFQISITIYFIISLLLIMIVIGVFLIPALVITDVVLTIIAAINTYDGKWYRYPMTIRLIK